MSIKKLISPNVRRYIKIIVPLHGCGPVMLQWQDAIFSPRDFLNGKLRKQIAALSKDEVAEIEKLRLLSHNSLFAAFGNAYDVIRQLCKISK